MWNVDIREPRLGKTALYFAGEHNQKGFAALLIDNRSDPDTISTSGKTVLYCDTVQGFDEVTFLFIEGNIYFYC